MASFLSLAAMARRRFGKLALSRDGWLPRGGLPSLRVTVEDDSQLDAAFPLRVATQATRDRRGAPRYLARRLRAADDRDSLSEDAVRSLNSLAEARGNGRFARRPVCRIEKDKLTEGEQLALSRVGGALRGSLPRPAERDICSDGALCELLKCLNFLRY